MGMMLAAFLISMSSGRMVQFPLVEMLEEELLSFVEMLEREKELQFSKQLKNLKVIGFCSAIFHCA